VIPGPCSSLPFPFAVSGHSGLSTKGTSDHFRLRQRAWQKVEPAIVRQCRTRFPNGPTGFHVRVHVNLQVGRHGTIGGRGWPVCVAHGPLFDAKQIEQPLHIGPPNRLFGQMVTIQTANRSIAVIHELTAQYVHHGRIQDDLVVFDAKLALVHRGR
jgi:hypothetical protein